MKKIIINQPMENTTIVYLTPEQIALFILFQENYDNIAFLLAHKVFNMKNGNVNMSFDSEGRVKSLKKEIFEYRFPKE